MKQILISSILALTFLAFTTPLITPLPIGADLPMKDMKLKDVSGKEISMQEIPAPNGLLVVFSCNTCPYVVKSEERISELSDLTKKLGFGMIIINSNEANRDKGESLEEMVEYAKEKKINCFYTLDTESKMADAFGANRTPECFLFDKTQKLVYHGAIDDNVSDPASVKRKHLYEAMTEMTTGKAVSVTETKSIGCTIKRKEKKP
jgi:thioredoxin-related protein